MTLKKGQKKFRTCLIDFKIYNECLQTFIDWSYKNHFL
jgi:hypothetical protein